MTSEETRAIVTVSLLAAFADGEKHERERAEIKRIADGLAGADGVHLPTLYQDVLLKRVSLAGVLPTLARREARQLAYEMAVCVCDADGTQSPAERDFLAGLARELGLEAASSRNFAQQAEELAAAPWTASGSAMSADDSDLWKGFSGAKRATATATAPSAAGPAARAPGDSTELDSAILNAAILNGALELLPESLSTLAIIPLQMKLVYRIGKAHGYELDSGHVKDFLATVGVGLTSQYLEQAGRKLLGGVLGRFGGGKLLRGVGNQAVSSGMSFASTYALGHVAKRYYAGGRTLSAQMLKDAYAGMTREAQGLQAQYLPAIQERARTLDTAKVLQMVKSA